MYESIFWTGDNLEEVIQFCGNKNAYAYKQANNNIDEQTLYIMTTDGLKPVAYDNSIKYDDKGMLFVD